MICPHCKKMIWDPPRTTGPRSQSACLNGWIAFLCRYGTQWHNFEERKIHVKHDAIKHGFPAPTEIVIGEGDLREVYLRFKSEAECTQSEILALIEAVKDQASNEGVILPEYPKEERRGSA